MLLLLVLIVVGILFLYGFVVTVGVVLWLLPVLVVGLLVGAIASAITKSRHGMLGDVVIGLVGSVVGGTVLAVLFHHHYTGLFSVEGIK